LLWVVISAGLLVHLQMIGNWALGRGFDLPDLDVRRPTLNAGGRVTQAVIDDISSFWGSILPRYALLAVVR
jgi:hypothetical protein